MEPKRNGIQYLQRHKVFFIGICVLLILLIVQNLFIKFDEKRVNVLSIGTSVNYFSHQLVKIIDISSSQKDYSNETKQVLIEDNLETMKILNEQILNSTTAEVHSLGEDNLKIIDKSMELFKNDEFSLQELSLELVPLVDNMDHAMTNVLESYVFWAKISFTIRFFIYLSFVWLLIYALQNFRDKKYNKMVDEL